MKSNEDHRAVLEAIRQGDAEAARRVHHAHRSHARKVITDLLGQHRLQHI